MDEITRRLENLDDLSADELAQLSADIRAAYEAARADGPADGESGEAYAETLIALRDGLRAVTDRQGTLATEQAEADAALAAIDAEMATLAGDLSDEDAAALSALSDEDQATLRDLDEDGRTALAEWVTATAEAPAEPETPEEPTAEVVELPTEPEAPAEEDEADRLSRAAAALRRSPRAAQPTPAPEPVEVPVLMRSYDEERPIDAKGLAKRLRSQIASYGKVPDREVRVASIMLDPDLPRIDTIEDPDSWYKEQLADLRAHRQASAAGAANGVRQASGALCAPAKTDYSVVVLGSEDQPTRALFPTAGESDADSNKAVEFVQALTFTQLEDAAGDTFGDDDPSNSSTASTKGIGSATATQNALALNNANSPYPKTTLAIDCPDLVTCEPRMVWAGLRWDNLGASAWPELVAAGDKGMRIALAKEMEELRLQDWYDAADAANRVFAPQTTGQLFSGSHSLVQSLVTLVTFDRNDKRDPNAPYVAVVPHWVAPALASEMLAMLDIASGSMSVEEAKAEIIRRYGITIAEYVDAFGKTTDARTTSNGVSTVLPALSASGLTPQFPAEARIGIARDDAAFVRQGFELDLGVVRTESDIEDNFYRTFMETTTRLCFRDKPIVADVRVNASAHTSGSVAATVDNAAGSGS